MPADAVIPVASRSTRWLVGVAVLSLLASAWLLVSPGEGPRRGSVDADGYSRSAIGHHGLLQFLRAEGQIVLQSRGALSPGACGLYVLAEPRDLRASDDDRFTALLPDAGAVLLVLPKRKGVADPERPDWVQRVELLPVDEVAATLRRVAGWFETTAPRVVRPERTTRWRHPASWPIPTLATPPQLMSARGSSLESVIACDEGVLLGRLGALWVLADPDLIANHGLHRADNPELVLALLERVRQPGAIVFDETVHGHHLEASIWQAAGTFPFVLVSAQILLLLAAAAWAARGRFGPVQREAPAIAAGKRFLIDNVAALLTHAGSVSPSLRRYARQRVRRCADALHAPAGLDDEACRNFVLARLPAAERADLADALAAAAGTAANAVAAVATARRIRQLTEGPLHARIRHR